MGLLDNIVGSSMDDPKTLATMRLVQGLLSPGGAMRGLSSGLLGYGDQMAQAKQQAAMEEMRKLQLAQHQMALQQAQRQQSMQEMQDKFRASIPSPQMQASQSALQGGGGPTQANASQIAPVSPDAQMMHGALQAGLVDPVQYIQSQRKDTAPLKLGAGEGLYDPKTFKPLVVNPKEDSTPGSIKEYNFAKMQGYPGTFQQFQLEQKRAGASNVSVNTGQHGFDNTLKLRSDFRSEPVYKAHQEMQSAYSQIQQALKQGTPVGDLAGATKIMKLLDPGSVVRESELGMAMSSTGLLDRAQNYAQNIISGNKLTPQQRKEFQQLADTLLAQSANLYNSKRGEYGQIAKRNMLNFEDVTGAEAAVPKVPSIMTQPGKSDGWSITPLGGN